MDTLGTVAGHDLVDLAPPLEAAWWLVGHQRDHPVQRFWPRKKTHRPLPSWPIPRQDIRVGVGDGPLRNMALHRGDPEDRLHPDPAGDHIDQSCRIAHQRFTRQHRAKIDRIKRLGMRRNQGELL